MALESHDIRSGSLSRRLVAGALVVNLFVAGLVVVSMQQMRERFQRQAEVDGQNLTRLLETAITASFDQVDLALLAVADEHERLSLQGPIDAGSFEGFLGRHRSRAPILMSLRTTDAAGWTQFNVPSTHPAVNIADRDYFITARDEPTAGLVVSPPYMGRIITTPVMIFVRRLWAPGGDFVGIAAGSVPCLHLGQMLSLAEVGPHGVAALRWKDMRVVVERAEDSIHVQTDDRTDSPQLREAVTSGRAATSYDARSPVDGLQRTFSIRRFERFPLYVVVGLAEADYLAGWRRTIPWAAALVGCFTLLTVAVAAFAHRAWRRRLADERLLLERNERLRESEELFRIAFQTNRDSINLNRLSDAVFVAVNEGFTRISGWTEEEVLGRSSVGLGVWPEPADRDRLASGLARDGFVDNLETHFAGKDGRTITGLMSARLITVRGEKLILSITRDVTAWKQAEQERDRLREQIRQAQKLESIGQLAGGVAHDFNNLLTVILSCTEALRMDLAAGRSACPDDVEQIDGAGARARDLTRQLLAFARKQVISPVRLDLGAVARNSERLLRRVLREDVALAVEVEEELWPVWCDPGQIEQVLLNLAVNARDAMPSGGTLAIEVRNLRVEAAAAALDRPEGEWVQLVVRDDGVGMPADVRAHLFEPFYTTKAPGKGTGLGLATVHGIVTQSGGHIRVESEPGAGTRFEICLPRTDFADASPAPAPPESKPGTETVLLVEDDARVREVTVRALQGAGYRILVAGDGNTALQIVAQRSTDIDLLITDLVMPGLGGRAVAEEARRRVPGLRVLFVSGYAGDGLADQGVADPRQFLAKPFTASALLARVREVLDVAPARTGTG